MTSCQKYQVFVSPPTQLKCVQGSPYKYSVVPHIQMLEHSPDLLSLAFPLSRL